MEIDGVVCWKPKQGTYSAHCHLTIWARFADMLACGNNGAVVAGAPPCGACGRAVRWRNVPFEGYADRRFHPELLIGEVLPMAGTGTSK